MAERLLVWRGIDGFRAEVAHVTLGERRLHAWGTQLGVDPLGYRVDYELSTGADYVTDKLELRSAGAGWRRRIVLHRGPDGSWDCRADQSGESELAQPGGDPEAVRGALDCDLGLCPLTNTMPVLRHALADGGEPRDFVMAWVSVPDLSLHRSEQRYEPLGAGRVRYSSGSFTADLELDGEGFVVRYPGMAERA